MPASLTMLILASASPRRRELLTLAGFHYEVRPADVVEELIPGEPPIAAAIRLATIKAQAVQALSPERSEGSVQDAVILGADTLVVSPRGVILGKPRDAAHAAEILRTLSGATHQVITGVCVAWADRIETAAEVTSVTMRALSDTEIDDYIATGEPMDKAGAYAIQGRAARWIPRIHGDYSNVVGLPLALATAMLEAAEVYPA